MVMRSPRAKERARSPSGGVSKGAQGGVGGLLAVLGQEMLEEVKIQVLVVFCLLGEGHKEANQENDDDEEEERNGVLECAQNPLADRLLALLGGILVVLLVVKVGKRNDEQAEHSVERVQQVVDDLQRVGDVVDLVRGGPVLLAPEAGAAGRRDEGDVDGDQQDCGQQREGSEDGHNGDGGGAVARRLVDEDEDGGYGQQDANGDGIGDPDEACLDERHGAAGRSSAVSNCSTVGDCGLSVRERGPWLWAAAALVCL